MPASQRFLIVKIGALGDVCFAMPAVRALREAFPGCRVDWLVGSRDQELIQGLPGLERLWVVDTEAVFRRRWRVLLPLSWKWGRAMPRYSALLLLHRNWGHLAWLSTFRPPLRSGPTYRLSRAPSRFPGVVSVVVPPLGTHESLAIREVVSRVAADLRGNGAFAWKWDFSHIPSPATLLREVGGPYWVVHTGGGNNTGMSFGLKQWPHWKAWLEEIADGSAARWVLVGAPSEQTGFPNHPRVLNWIGRTGVRELVGLIREAEGLVGVDSGPLHLADALGIPTIGLYGPTSETSWGLIGPNHRILSTRPPCSPCYRDDGSVPSCPYHHRCMEELLPRELARAVPGLAGPKT